MSRLALVLLTLLVLAGCGGSGGKGGDGVPTVEQRTDAPGLPPEARRALDPQPTGFPSARGRTLQEVADTVKPGLQVGLGAATFTPGRNRIPFGLVDEKQDPVYGPTALYFAETPDKPARGPVLAPGDSLVPDERFRSEDSDRDDLKLVYAARLNLPKARRYAILAVTQAGGKSIGGATQLDVARSSAVPAVGERAPRPATDTKRTQPNAKLLDTRVPPDDMHSVSLREAAGRKPVALLFATPQLCQSRVCGPVTDLLLQLKQRYGRRMAFIHQEVYARNKPPKLRPSLRAFNLRTEPWLFVLDRRGRVAARLEGIFGLRETEQALKAGLR